jgi:cytochrome c55X
MTMRGGLGPALLPATLAGCSDGIPRTPMPPWRALISDDEALWLVERLKEGLDEE